MPITGPRGSHIRVGERAGAHVPAGSYSRSDDGERVCQQLNKFWRISGGCEQPGAVHVPAERWRARDNHGNSDTAGSRASFGGDAGQ